MIFASCMVALKRTCALAFKRDENFKMVLKDNSRTVEFHGVTAPPNAA